MKADGKGDEGEEGWIQLSDAYHHLPPPWSNLNTCTPSQQHEDTLQSQRRREMKNLVTFKQPAKLENRCLAYIKAISHGSCAKVISSWLKSVFWHKMKWDCQKTI